jgi:hypothetical protein
MSEYLQKAGSNDVLAGIPVLQRYKTLEPTLPELAADAWMLCFASACPDL